MFWEHENVMGTGCYGNRRMLWGQENVMGTGECRRNRRM